MRPPHYIVLACVKTGSLPVPTVLARFDRLNLEENDIASLRAAPFVVRNGRKSFYATVCDAGEVRVRYDRGCMAPTIGGTALAARLDQSLEQAPLHAIEWSAQDVVVIDNWNVLHGRGFQAEYASTDRTLLRVSVQ